MVSFRLSPEEYDVFHACATAGGLSISDFARAALREHIHQTTEVGREAEMDRLESRVRALAAEVRRLGELLGRDADSLPAPAGPVSRDH